MSRHALSISLLLCLVSSPLAQGPGFTVDGAAPRDRLGQAVAAAGDVNADGSMDLIVGAPEADAAGPDSGLATVLSGKDGSVLWSFRGNAGDEAGRAVAGAGDVNGDGYADVIVGLPKDDTSAFDAGSARVFSGRDGSELHAFFGSVSGDWFGAAVAGASDVNGDGYDDVIVGAPRADLGGRGSGAATVYSGLDGAVLHAFMGQQAGDQFGFAVDGAGDVDGDGMADLVVGAPFAGANGPESGSMTVLSGLDGSVLDLHHGDDAGDRLGWAVAGAGDLDGDGLSEVAGGAPNDDNNGIESGSARVFSAADGSVHASVDGLVGGRGLGWSVASAPDVDGDGVDDLVFGAPGGGEGQAVVHSGATGQVLRRVTGSAPGDGLGASVAGLGDTNGDGFGDVAYGAPEARVGFTRNGRVRVDARAPYDTHLETLALTPGEPGARFAIRMNRAGDVNADGIEDYVIGAHKDKGRAGAVRVYSGADHSLIHEIVGQGDDNFFGVRVGAAGDYDKDGYDDIIVGAYHDETNGDDAGMAQVFSGADGSILLTMYGEEEEAHLGSAVGTTGDVDGDGILDYFVGLGLGHHHAGGVEMRSGATGEVIWSIEAAEEGEWLGWDGNPVGDLNGDGIGDLVVGAPSGQVQPVPGTGYALVLSGLDGSTILRLNGRGVQSRFGWVVGPAGDVDADGVMDIIVGSDGFDTPRRIDAGRAAVFSGVDGRLIHNRVGAEPGNLFGPLGRRRR